MKSAFDGMVNNYNTKKAAHRQNWKKIQALRNFAKANVDTNIWEELECLIRFYEKGFLWPSQQQLLDEILAYHKINYLDWALKDAWVKQQLFYGSKCKRGEEQLEFFFFELEQKRIESREKSPFYSKLERYKLLRPRMSA